MEDRRNPCRDLGQDRKSGFIQIPNRTLLRQSSRQGKKVIKRTLANLSSWPEPLVEGLRTLLKGGTAVENLAESFEKVRSLPHGHVGAVWGTLRQLGLLALLSRKPGRGNASW